MICFCHQAKERQKKKGGGKGIRIDAEGDASLEDLVDPSSLENESELALDPDNAKHSNKKVKSFSNSVSVTENKNWTFNSIMQNKRSVNASFMVSFCGIYSALVSLRFKLCLSYI